MNRIAVWNTAFLGDAILTLPLIQSLHNAYPDAEIHFFTRRGFSSLFKAHPALCGVTEYDKRGGAGKLPDFIRTVRQQGFELWISAHQSIRSAMIARGSGAGRRIGYSGQWFSPLFYTDRVERCFYEFQEIERLLRLLEPLSLAPEHVSDWPELVLPVDARERAEEFFAANFSGPVLGMHPGSVWGTKRWPVEYFAETGARALSAGAQVVLFAGPGEEDMACRAEALMREKLGESVAGRIKNLSGALSLVDLAAYIGRLNCYLTNDSGPMHMAWSQRVPVVALFGPTVRKLGFAPRGKDSIMMEATNLDCRPCGLHGPQSCPRGHHHCMTLLTPELVWPEVASRLGV